MGNNFYFVFGQIASAKDFAEHNLSTGRIIELHETNKSFALCSETTYQLGKIIFKGTVSEFLKEK